MSVSKEYKISMIDEAPPREWSGPNGTIYYITVGLDGHSKPVSIGKKSPDALKVGDTVHGTIIPTDYLTDKWKGEAAPQTTSSGAKSGWQPKDEKQITQNMVWKNLLEHFDVPELKPETKQWSEFWALVELHTEMLLGKKAHEVGVKETLADQWKKTTGTEAEELPPIEAYEEEA